MVQADVTTNYQDQDQNQYVYTMSFWSMISVFRN